jgi:hypothetical protein
LINNIKVRKLLTSGYWLGVTRRFSVLEVKLKKEKNRGNYDSLQRATSLGLKIGEPISQMPM